MNVSYNYSLDCTVQVNGLAVDWVSRTIYWTDAFYHRISVASINNRLMWRIVVDTNIISPHHVAVFPQQGQVSNRTP